MPEALALIAADYGIGLMLVRVMESWNNLVAFRRLAERPNIAVTMIRRREDDSSVLDALLQTMQRPPLKTLYSAPETRLNRQTRGPIWPISKGSCQSWRLRGGLNAVE